MGCFYFYLWSEGNLDLDNFKVAKYRGFDGAITTLKFLSKRRNKILKLLCQRFVVGRVITSETENFISNTEFVKAFYYVRRNVYSGVLPKHFNHIN